MLKNKLSFITLAALVLGVLCGIFLPDVCGSFAFVGTYYIKFLKYLIAPVVFCSITVSLASSKKGGSKLVLKSVLLFTVMFVVTFLLSSLFIVILKPASSFVFETVEWNGNTVLPSFGDLFVNLLPKEPKKLLTGGYLFFIIIVSFVLGLILSFVDKNKYVVNFISKIRDFLYYVLQLLMYVTPLAVFSLMANTVVNYGSLVLSVGIRYIVTAYICGIITMILVMILPVYLFKKMSPVTYISKVYKIWLITLTTCSSAATLPYTLKTCKEDLGIDSSITDVVVPLGCTIHMCGGAVSFSLLALFCSSLYGIEINATLYILMLIAAVLINMAAPGIPNGGVVIGATFLSMFGIPLDFIGFYSGIYKLLDMLYTTLNVTGDITANVLLGYKKSLI